MSIDWRGGLLRSANLTALPEPAPTVGHRRFDAERQTVETMTTLGAGASRRLRVRYHACGLRAVDQSTGRVVARAAAPGSRGPAHVSAELGQLQPLEIAAISGRAYTILPLCV